MSKKPGLVLGVVTLPLLAAILVSVAPAQSQAPPEPAAADVIRVRRFELVDDKGKARASLCLEGDGAVLRLMDSRGTIRVKIGSSSDGSGIVLLDDRTEPGVHLLTNSTGTSIALTKPGKEKRVIEP